MNKVEIKEWLKSLKDVIGEPQYHGLWNYEEAIDTAIKTLSDTEEREWIPVSEFPKSGGYHLVTTDKGYVDVAWFDLSIYACDCGWREVKDRPIAWMPLPEPYKGGDME